MVRIRLFDKLLKSSSSTKIKKTETSTSSSEENFFEINNESTLLNLINDNFACNCCFEILRYPVTLTCGHSFCQLCIANWYLASESSKCPTCRQEWSKIPQINCILKSTIKTVVSHELIQTNIEQDIKNLNEYLKKCDNLNQEEIKKIKEYETKFKQKAKIPILSTNTTNNAPQMTNRLTLNDVRVFARRALNYRFYMTLGFILGILVGFIVFFILWCISSVFLTKFNSRDTTYESFIKIRKKYALKTEEWTSSDVQEWLAQLGPWTGDIMYSAKNANLDGQGLLSFNHKVLVEHPYEINDEQIRNLLLDSIKILDRCRFEIIDFWQLKNANKFQIFWNSFVFESFPRVLILYTYFYSEMSYNIFERYALKKIENVDEKDLIMMDDFKRKYLNQNNHLNIWSNMSIFHSDRDSKNQSKSLNYLLRYPYLGFKDIFSLFFYQTNSITSFFVSINCIIITLFEVLLFTDMIISFLLRDKSRQKILAVFLLKQNLKNFFVLSSIYITWNFVPNIIIDFLFLNFVFIKVFYNVYLLVSNSFSFVESIAHYFIRPSH